MRGTKTILALAAVLLAPLGAFAQNAGGGGGVVNSTLTENTPFAIMGNFTVPAVWDAGRAVWKFSPECSGYEVGITGNYALAAADTVGSDGTTGLEVEVTDSNQNTYSAVFMASNFDPTVRTGTVAGTTYTGGPNAGITTVLWRLYVSQADGMGGTTPVHVKSRYIAIVYED